LAAVKPVIIDESDESLTSYRQALAIGYRGVSSKNCKGPIKSLINAGITWQENERTNSATEANYVLTGEDLCCVGIVPLQSDLCLVATLGLEHVERNGHHYHAGLSYLPIEQQQAAVRLHPDLYEWHGNVAQPAVRGGTFSIGSLQCTGFGFAVVPDLAQMIPAEQWSMP
jgi:hypothetical protein